MTLNSTAPEGAQVQGKRGGKVKKKTLLAFLVTLLGALVLAMAGCGGGDDEGGGEEGGGGGGGGGGQTVKIVSDLPLQGSDRVQTEQMVRAIEFVLQEAGNKAGDHTLEYESFDDATAAKGAWDEAKCAENARAFVNDESVVGVIGTYNSGCAAIEIPILNEGSVAMVSPANTYAGLTHEAPGTEQGEPDKYYPTGNRNYVRVVASDDNQGKIGATYMKDTLGVNSVYILDDKELYGKGVADAFENFAREAGLEVAGHEGWDKDAPNYRALMTKIKGTGAEAIYIGGISTNNGGQLIKDKVSVLGDNEQVKLMFSDGFVITSLFEEAGPQNVEGAYGTAPTLPVEEVTGAGKEFLDAFAQAEGGKDIEVYTLYAAASAQVLVDAIGRSDGSREDVVAKLFETNLDDTVVGPMSFDEFGDPATKFETVYQAKGGHFEFVERAQIE
jgi:branched-chain amino acid transport system substrate-binding protein